MPRVHVQTRFSFFGKSGWKSDAAQNADMLFADERLKYRFDLFEAITIPSLLAQVDDDFTWDILSSSLMPQPRQLQLREMVLDRFSGRARVHFEPPAKAGRYFRNYQSRRYAAYSDPPLGAQVVLDDDDALSNDYVVQLRKGCLEAIPQLNDSGYVYLSFPRGFWLLFTEGLETPPRYIKVREPCVNLGLAAFGPANFAKNPYLTSHRVLHRRHPVRFLCGARPMYLRSVHGKNDSLPDVADESFSLDLLPAHQCARFPSLARFLRHRALHTD